TGLPSPLRLVLRTGKTSDACAGFNQSFLGGASVRAWRQLVQIGADRRRSSLFGCRSGLRLQPLLELRRAQFAHVRGTDVSVGADQHAVGQQTLRIAEQ